MKTFIASLLTVLLSFALPGGYAVAGEEEAKKLEEARAVLKEIIDIPEKGMPPALLKDAYGMAVIPGVIKVGFVVGGRFGRGVVTVKKDGGWSSPSFVTITGGSLGWQIGAQSTDVILVFKTKKGIEGLKKGKFTLGADAAIAAGPVGRRAEAATDEQLKAEIYSYSRSRGLFAGVSLEGSALQIDDESNSAFYGKKGITAEEILGRPSSSAPAPARAFTEAIPQ